LLAVVIDITNYPTFYRPMLLNVTAAGTRLLTTGEVLQMWQLKESKDLQAESKEVEFYFDDIERSAEQPSSHPEWLCIWHCKPANPVTLAKFSSDGLLFATTGKVGCSSFWKSFGLHVSCQIHQMHCQFMFIIYISVRQDS
jgi:hypothetical protein